MDSSSSDQATLSSVPQLKNKWSQAEKNGLLAWAIAFADAHPYEPPEVQKAT
ncbi:hypothetical protein C0995_008286, partial [Termitomyces sp. Mi166